MNVTLPDNRMDKKAIVVYSIIILICIFSIIAVLWMQFFDGKIVATVGTLKGKSDYDYNNLKSEFNELFTNNLQNSDEKYENKKEKLTEDLVFTGYEKSENSDENYNIQVKIPYINVKGNVVKKYNEEIKNIFANKVDSIINNKNKHSTYLVEYSSYIEEGILSVVIKAEIQEGTSAQRTIIKTYNYNLENNSEISFQELLQLKNVSKNYAQEKIDKEVQMGAKKAQDIRAMGYDVYQRDLEDEMYKVENVSEFYFNDGTIYVIFAYGNNKFTNEIDLAIF